MTTTSNRRPDPGKMSGETLMLLIVVLTVLIGGGGIYAAVRIGHQIDGTAAGLPADPFTLVIGLFTGKVSWPASGTWIIAAAFAVLVVATVLIVRALAKNHRRSSRVDRAALVMGSGRDIEPLRKKNAQVAAARWGLATEAVGVPIGCTVRGNEQLVGSYEDTHLDIWGPRTGKTTSRAIPAALAAPGAVLITSNKRDIVDATRDVRATLGPVWIFDPQNIVGEDPSWWWNPLSYVTDEVKAAQLADHFAAGSRDPDARTDAFFDGAAQDLLAGLLLAAALDNRSITDVYIWISRPTDDEPVEILRRHDYPLTAHLVSGVIYSADKQRSGVYGSAQKMVACLTNRQVAKWVTPQSGGYDSRPQFNPAEFVQSASTLYSLSVEGRGTAGPLITALTVAVVEAAEDLAKRSAGARLAIPMLVVLDEAANVCRWRELPNLYSHYGSRGIVLMTILQSWSQGVEVWGESGMKKLFSAANIFVYGGGVREEGFLETLSKLIGDFDHLSSSTSTGRGQQTVSKQLIRQRILDVDALGSLPKGRAVVLASGARPTLIRTQPWMTGNHAAAIEASILAHDPQANLTLTDASAELAAVAATEVSIGDTER